CAGLTEGERTRLRRHEIGFIYQFHQLLPEFSAMENVVIPQMILGKSKRVAETRARALLSGLGLGDRVDHRPAELSGGEQQRTAICRGLANAPKLLLADEPTGNLDPKTSEYVFQELVMLIRQQGVAALIATHNMDLARRMDRILRMEDGRVVEISPSAVG
ncbi:MAG: ABC transporter, partial [Hyphomicrobium sp.]